MFVLDGLSAPDTDFQFVSTRQATPAREVRGITAIDAEARGHFRHGVPAQIGANHFMFVVLAQPCSLTHSGLQNVSCMVASMMA